MEEIIKILSKLIEQSSYPLLILFIFACIYTFREFILSNNFKYLIDRLSKLKSPSNTLKEHDLFNNRYKMNILINKFNSICIWINQSYYPQKLLKVFKV